MVTDAPNPKRNPARPPDRMPVNPQKVPVLLKQQTRWLCWTWSLRGNKWDKPPYRATSTDPSTWTTFEEALANAPADGGIGFAMGDGCGLVGVDVDNCRNPETGEIDAYAQTIIEALATYAELSPSGTGVKLWLALDDTSKLAGYRRKNETVGLEVYYSGRYFTVTGHAVGTARDIAPAADAFFRLMDEHMTRDEPTGAQELRSQLPDDPTRTAEIAREAITYCDPNCGYEEWISIGMAVRCLGPEYFSVWDEWSADGDGYPGSPHCKKHWDSFPGPSGKITLGTLFHYAKRGGYVMPPLERIQAAKADPREEAKHIARYTATRDGKPTIIVYRDEPMRWREGAGRYEPMRESEYRALIVNTLDKRLVRILPAHVSATREHHAAMNLVPSSVELPSWRDGNSWSPADCFATRDRIIHLPSFVAGQDIYSIPATPDYLCTNAADYSFDPNAPKPERWFNFLDQIFAGDREQIDLLQTWAGYTLTANTSLQKMLCMIGPPRSGKGETARVFMQVLGAGNVVGPPLASLAGEFGLQPLLHKGLAIIADARLSGRSDQAVITERLLAITGEDSISVNRKQFTHVTVRLPTRIMVLSNELPALRDSSGALANRMLVLETRRSFLNNEDPSLPAALSKERSGILMWFIEGWRKLRQAERFTPPSSTARKSVELIELSSPVRAFVGDQCIIAPEAETPKDQLYAYWRSWCDHNGHRPSNSAIFARDLMAAYPNVTASRPRAANGSRVHTYRGIALVPDEPLPADQGPIF